MGNHTPFTNYHLCNIALYVYETNLIDLLGIDGCVALRRHPRVSLLPKPFKKMLRILLAFLLLIGLRKRAFDTASKQKSLSLL